MPAKVRIELDSAEIRNMLKTDPGIRDDLERRAEAVRDRAGGEPDYESSVWTGFDRQRASVRTNTADARRAEAENHTLMSALDAAR